MKKSPYNLRYQAIQELMNKRLIRCKALFEHVQQHNIDLYKKRRNSKKRQHPSLEKSKKMRRFVREAFDRVAAYKNQMSRSETIPTKIKSKLKDFDLEYEILIEIFAKLKKNKIQDSKDKDTVDSNKDKFAA